MKHTSLAYASLNAVSITTLQLGEAVHGLLCGFMIFDEETTPSFIHCLS